MEIFIKIILLIFLSFFCYWISGIIHELGHIIVGLLHGWKFWMIVVGPIGIKRSENKLKLYFEKNIVMWGGFGGTLPSDNKEDNIKIWSKILLSGPAVSILTGAIFLSLNFIYLSIIFVLLGAMPIGMGIACLLPLKTGITYTDGKRWSRIRNGGQESAEELSIFNMMLIDLFKKDMITVEYDDFAPLLKAELPALKYYGYYYLYRYHSARNDEAKKLEALNELNEMKKSVPKIIIDDCGV